MFKSEMKEKKMISLLTTIQFLKSEATTTVRSKNDIYLLHVSFQFQSKYPSKVSAMKVTNVLFFFFIFDRKVAAASDFHDCTIIKCDLVNKFLIITSMSNISPFSFKKRDPVK